jgi:ActR/RegA family two-component response regulator
MTLDLSLGEHDGIELLRIAANRALTAMSVVVISGCDERIVNSTRRVAEALGLSFTASLSKPLDLDQLRDALLLPAQSHAFAKEPKLGSVIPRERILQAFAEREFSDRLRHRPGLPVCSVDGRPANLALGFASNPAAGQGASGGLARRWGDP